MVEEIVDCKTSKRVHGRKEERLYRIRWTGWNEGDDTWEPLSNLDGCKELVHEYHNKKGWDPPVWPRQR